jgi:hypothetical protein
MPGTARRLQRRIVSESSAASSSFFHLLFFYFNQLPVSGRSKLESRLNVGSATDSGGSHQGDPGAVRVVLRDGFHLPAVQDMRRERQRRQNRAMRAPPLHTLSKLLAGK